MLAATLTEADDRLFSAAASAAINRYHPTPTDFSHTHTPESSFHDLKSTLEYLVSGQNHLEEGDVVDDDGLDHGKKYHHLVNGAYDSEQTGDQCGGGEEVAVSFNPPQSCNDDDDDDENEDEVDGYRDDSDSGMTGDDDDDDDDNNNSNKNNNDDDDDDNDDGNDDENNSNNENDNNDDGDCDDDDDGYAIALASQPPTPLTSRDFRVTFLSKPLGITLSKATNGAAEVTRVVPNGNNPSQYDIPS